MKKIITLILILTFISCSMQETPTQKFNTLKAPVVLFAKSESFWCKGCWGIEVKDGNGKLHSFGNATQIANAIGDYYKVGDTLKQ